MIYEIKTRLEMFFVFMCVAFIGLIYPEAAHKILDNSVSEYIKNKTK